MPLASLYRQAKAPLEIFCQHGGRVNTARVPLPRRKGGETLMTAVAVELLTRPPATDAARRGRHDCPRSRPDAVEFVADTDRLLTMCSCSASSDQPYSAPSA